MGSDVARRGRRQRKRFLYVAARLGHLIPDAALEDSPGTFLVDPTPLLKEEWNIGSQTLVSDVNHPVFRHWSGARPRFPTDDDPVYTLQVEVWQWCQQGL